MQRSHVGVPNDSPAEVLAENQPQTSGNRNKPFLVSYPNAYLTETTNIIVVLYQQGSQWFFYMQQKIT